MKLKSFIKILSLVIVFGFIFSDTKAQKFEHIKQIYSLNNNNVIIDRILEFKSNKYIIVGTYNSEGDLYYDDKIFDPSPGLNIKRNYNVIIKVDKDNNFISYKNLSEYFDVNTEFGPVENNYGQADDMICFSVRKTGDILYNGKIVCFDEEFDEKFSINTKNLVKPRIVGRDGYLYINTWLQDSIHSTIIGRDTSYLSSFYHWVFKYDMIKQQIVSKTAIYVEPIADILPVKINEAGEMYLSGKFGYLFASPLAIEKDTIYNLNGNNDGFLIKLDAKGELIYLRHLQGTGTERFGNLLLGENGEVYIIANNRYTNDSNLEGQRVICGNDKNYFNILKLDAKGKILWQLPIENLTHLIPYMIDLDEESLLISTNYNEKVIVNDIVFQAPNGSNFLIFKLDKNDGTVNVLKNIHTPGTEVLSNNFVGNSNRYLTGPIVLDNFTRDDIIFDDHVLKVSGDINQTWVQMVANLNLNLPVSTSEYQKETKVLIYPNPVFKEQLVKIVSDDKIKSVSVVDIVGRIFESHNNGNEIFIQSNVPGIYFMKIETETHQYLKKIVINF